MIVDSLLMEWLMEGDISLRFQTFRDLQGEVRPELQKRIAKEGWGKQLLKARTTEGHWGQGFYQPKWTSSHYTLLDLRNLEIAPDILVIRDTIQKIAREEKGPDGGINPSGQITQSDVCINGMFLNYACYFRTEVACLHSVIDFILDQQMPGGAWNCRYNRSGARHPSMHSTLSVLEGICEYHKQGYTYRLKALLEAAVSGREFLLKHQLFRSDRTGEIIQPAFLRMPYPPRWRYDILRALDYFRYSGVPRDERLLEALQLLISRRSKDGTWKLHAPYPGKVHFDMEKTGQPSRWNTLRMLRVLAWYGIT